MKHQIVSRWDGAKVLFECDLPEDTPSGLATRAALEKATAAKADLRDADLRDANLRGANLRDADLRDANLRGAYLSGANLSDADLRGAYLSDADLSDADLRGANLRDADLRDANLRGANLRDADLRDANLRGAYLSDADLSDADLRGANLRGANLRGANLRGADLKNRATPEQSIENLDKVRAIILDNTARLEMGHWHDGDEWRERTCAEETLCSTTHCLAGWLQVCSTNPEIRGMGDPELAGILSAPVAAKMFFKQPDEVLTWLENRAYADEVKPLKATE